MIVLHGESRRTQKSLFFHVYWYIHTCLNILAQKEVKTPAHERIFDNRPFTRRSPPILVMYLKSF